MKNNDENTLGTYENALDAMKASIQISPSMYKNL